jgi:hypothetical protein
MAPDERGASCGRRVGASAENLGQDVRAERRQGIRDQVDRADGLAPMA